VRRGFLEVWKITAIWDTDHGTDNEGWYVRFRDEEGHEVDSVPIGGYGWPRDISEDEIRQMVESCSQWEGITLPDGWRDLIEVHR
jgi:hypothetical protein